ncbi:antitoxin MazE-like protein [Rhizobium tumorigenes]|uniref:antitoxin MazE-like protein n=1 Tax=Rhizobium tumorigenes TaxID=2041385 RepID=UPI000DA97B8F
MGRPREISPEERAELVSQGYRPVEIWVPDLSNEIFRRQVQKEMQSIAAAAETDDVSQWTVAVGPTDWDKP